MFEMREDLKNVKDNKRQTCTWLPFMAVLYLAVRLFSLMYIQQVDPPNLCHEKKTRTHNPYVFTRTMVHMSQLWFLTLLA